MSHRKTATAVALALALTLIMAASAIAKPRPNLSVKKVGSPPASVLPGEQFDVTGKVANRGKRKGSTRVEVYLSESRGAKGGSPIGDARVKKIPAKGKKGFSVAATVPDEGDAVEPGEYFVVACVRKRGNAGPSRCKGSKTRVDVGSGPAPEPTFTPGARTLGDPVLPQIGNGGYDAEHYDIDLDYDRTANVFNSATTTISALATQDLSEFSLDFQELEVERVLVNGSPAQFSQVESTPDLSPDPAVTQPMKLVITPSSGLPAGSEFEVEISYSGEPQVFTDPDLTIEGWVPACYTVAMVETCDSNFVVGAPMGSQGWFPSNNHPTDKATFDTVITVASGEQAFGAGELTGPPIDDGDGTVTWSWSEDDPTPTYLVTATNGDFNYSETTVTEAMTGRTMPVYNALDPSATPDQETNFDTLVALNAEMIDFFGSRYGAYPLDSYGAIYDRAPNVGYAIEMQTKSHFSSLPNGSAPDSFPEVLYAHELVHSWWGNSVSLENWNDIWFNEGWTTFSEWLFRYGTGRSTVTPAQRFADQYASGPAEKWEIAPAVLDGDPANIFAGFPVYQRGAMTVEGYREIVGTSRFYELVATLQTDYAYGNIGTREFIALAKENSGFSGARLQLLDDYFQQWLYGETKPTITPGDFD